jgi:hypothetical protein
MSWCTTFDLDKFAAAAGGYLRSRAAENTLLLSAAQAARGAEPDGPGLLFGWWEPPDGGEPRGAFVHDPTAPLLIAGKAPELGAALAATLAKLGRLVTGVDAPTEIADAFAAAWSQRAGTTVRAHRNCRVYRLAGAPPGAPPPGLPGPPGRLRCATAKDQALLADWLTSFATETAERMASASDLAADLIGYGGAVFWEVPQRPSRLRDAAHYLPIPHHRDAHHGNPLNGNTAQSGEPAQPMALVTLTRPVAGTVRIGVVYTPPERRHSGFATALTLAVSRAVLAGTGPVASGRVSEVVMITDKNRSDRWGGRLGYQKIGERAVLRFGPVTGPMPRAQPSGAMPRLPTGPLPRLPRLRR